MSRATVILPSAGEGRRLGLPYPKELVALGPQRTAIDATLESLPADRDLAVVVVVSPAKTATIRYLARYAEVLAMAFVHQRSDRPGCIGAVLSAKPWFGDRNLVLLPDQLVVVEPGSANPVSAALDALDDNPFCFITKQETASDRLARDGALRVECNGGDAHVVDYCDKPRAGWERFNAIWAGFAFRREAAEGALEILDRSTRGESVSQRDIEDSPLFGSPAIQVADCVDIGTWPALRDALLREGG